MTDEINPRAVSGDNGPPAHIAWADHAEELAELAQGMGEIKSEENAVSVGNLKNDATKAKRDTDAARSAAKKPHLDAGRAIDADFKPTIAKLESVISVATALLTPWMQQKEAERKAAEDEARRIAQEADEAARRAAAELDETDIDAVEDAVRKAAEAREAEQDAKATRTASAAVKSDGRSIGLRTSYAHMVADGSALLKHINEVDRAALDAFAAEWARKAVAKGERSIPGVEITEQKRAA